ncbi:polyhomeotic-like protein 2b [Syngnathoides biaculeatus]|uniref:polyhomeotic-like protein 2b n=1 Tax=Syngnathoides biaculeatus TaxID=300417 RepID=UPI002ADD3395|nr:polyhomeotic-like protein 2b [Syngnathoides biaculeatus]XP_061689336.1 polyhomeotic-like protein 2b [Syngnathoides biaculeatus]
MSEPGPPAAPATTTTTTTAATTTTSGGTSATTTGTSTTSSSSTTAASSNMTTPSTATTASASSTTTSCSSSSSSSSTSTTSTSSSSTTTTAARQAVPQISVYGGIPDRQTVQVIQQALHRQPNTAAQYLQQMYAAQQQHLMLQTAALQQQHSLSTAQLQSLAAVQQASIAAGRQNSQNGTTSQQTGSTQTTINLTASPAAAQLISRAQSITSAPTSISQQAVLLGSPSSPTLTASQAQMYLRAQMAQQSNVFQAQQSNLVQVARSLGRAVPLSPQLIFTPTATVTAMQSDSSAQNQVQNLAIRGQQGSTTSSSQTQTLQALSLKQSPVPIQPASLVKNPGQGGQPSAAVKSALSESASEVGKKGDAAAVTEARAINMSRNVTTVSAQPLIAPAYTQIQPHSLVQQHKQQQQFVVHHSQSSQRAPGQLLQTASIQPSPQPVPVLPKPAPHQPAAPGQHATIFHSTISSHTLPPPASSSSASTMTSQAKAQPVQLTAINLQIHPTASRPLVQECKDKPTSLVVRETCATSSVQQQKLSPPAPAPTPTPAPPQQPQSTPSQPRKPGEQPKSDPPSQGHPQGGGVTKRPAPAPGTPPPAMTPANDGEAPDVTAVTSHNGESKPPQAIVKPQVLTHVIEGFVIQEGAEPFPVCVERLPILINSPKKLDSQLSSDPDKTPVSNAANSDSEPEDLNQTEKDQEPKLTCEYCGWVDFAYTFKGSKRFCSMVCAKRYNVGCTKRIGLFRPEKTKPANRWRRRDQGRSSIEAKKRKISPSPQQTQGGSVSSPHPSQPSQEESSPCSEMSSYEEPPSPLSAASSGPPATPAPAPVPVQRQTSRAASDPEPLGRRDATAALCQPFLPNDPTKWNVEEVYEFICSLPGCQEIADEFRSQEIDGQALLLLKEDHLMSTMNIKLGPALKIFARINMLKDS